MEIPFEGRFDQETLFRAIWLGNRVPLRRDYGSWIIVLLILFDLYQLFSLLMMRPISLWRVAASLVFLALLVYLLFRVYFISRRTANRLWPTIAEQGLVRGRITPEGVIFVDGSGENEIPWEQFSRARKSPELVSLVTQTHKLSAFPRSFFRSDDDWRRFNDRVVQEIRNQA